ncbi:hypothetical protein Bca101_059236 [Brassica carinata]
MEDFDVLPSPILADLFQIQEFDQTVPDMFPTPIIISDDDTEIDDMVAPALIIILSDDDSKTDDIVPEVPSLAHPSPITISSLGTSGETLGDDSAEDHSSPPAPGVGMPSGSPPLEAFKLPISPMLPGLLDTTSIMIDFQQEFMIGWEALYCQSMEIMVDRDDDPLVHYADLMLSDEPSTQPMEPAHYQPMEPTYYKAVGSAYVPGGSTPYGDTYSTQSSYYGQGSDMFGDVGDGYVNPHGYPYHNMTYLCGPDLHPRCLACGGIGNLTGMCPRYDELSGTPCLHSAQPEGELSEWGYGPNCGMLLYIWRS